MSQKPSRRKRGAPTIQDVAVKAGVSPMTVSRVINGESSVRAATRDAVNLAIGELKYAPNRAARSLAGAAEIRVAILYNNPSATYLNDFLVGSLDQASRGNHQLILERCDTGPRAARAAEHCVSIGVHGVILPPPLCDSAAIIEILRKAGLPMVAVASGKPMAGVPAINIDDFRAASEMTAHLARLGHRRIGFIAGNPNQTASARRQDGYLAAVAALGLAHDERLVVPGLYTYRSGLDAAERLLELDEPPSAIFASNDDMAAAAVAVAHRHGLDVPGDLTVCGFDDSVLATIIWPELTTIRQPVADMGRLAVELLVSDIQARRAGTPLPPEQRVLDFSLIRRQSDAAPRRRPTALLALPRADGASSFRRSS